MIGQGAVIMSSMVVGKYLIIKKVIFDDYALSGGLSTVAPGTIFGKETVLGAVSSTLYNQVLEPEWIYTGVPARKFRKTKESLERRNFIRKVDVDEEKRVQVEHEVNVDEDKKHFLKPI
jgi:carbonic anhydrase/acetyltransferase-like protein (isoleucine patch superfamily)